MLQLNLKIYLDFESLLKGLQINDIGKNTYILKISRSYSLQFCYKVVSIDDEFSKPVVLYRGKNAVNKCIEAVLEEYDYCKKVIKKNMLIKILSCL